MDSGASAALLEWVNSVGKNCESLKELRYGRRLSYIIRGMQQDQAEISEQPNDECVDFWDFVRKYLDGSNYHNAADTINYEDAKSGEEFEIAKVVVLLLSLSITCPNHQKFMSDMMNLSNETQWAIRFILSETLDENTSPNSDVFEVLQRKAIYDQDCESAFSMSMSPAKSTGMTSFMSPIGESPVSILNRPSQTGNMSATQTPVKQIFKAFEEEVVYSAPASCPPFRKTWNCRLLQDSMSFVQSTECSPMQEFLSSPVVNYKIKIRDLNQKNAVLRKNLDAERSAKEELDKCLIEKESLIDDLRHKVRDLSRSVADKRELFDEIDELHEVRHQRDSLERENTILKHRIEKFDTYANESKDLKKILDCQYEKNSELTKQVRSLQTSLTRMEETSQESNMLTDSLKSLQYKNNLLEEEISDVTVHLRKIKSQNIELKEYYETQIQEYKSIIENKDAVEGESMGLFMEQRVEELQRKSEELCHKLESQAKELTLTQDMLETKDDSVRNMNEEIARLKVRNAGLQDSYDVLTDEKQKVTNSLNASMAKCEEINAFNESLKVQVATLEIKLIEFESQNTSISNELDSKKGDVTILKEKLKTTTSGLEASIQENCRLMKELETSAESLTYAKSEISDLREEIVQFQLKLIDMEQEMERMQTNEIEMDEEVVKLKQQLEVESERSSVLQIKLNENEMVIRDNVRQIEDLRENLNSKDDEVDGTKAFEIKCKALEEQIVILSTARDGAVLDLMRVNSQLEISEDHHKEDIRRFEMKIQTMKGDLEHYEEDNKTLRTLCEKLQDDNKELTVTNTVLKLENCEMVTKTKQYETLQVSLKKMEEKNSILMISNSYLKVENERLVSKLDENKSLQDSLNLAEEENKALETVNADLKCENEHLQIRLDNKESTAGLLKFANDDLQTTNNGLQQKVNDFSSTITMMREEIQAKDEKIAVLKEANKEFIETEKSRTDANGRQLKEEILVAKKELSDTNAKLSNVSEENKEYVKRCYILQDESDLLQVEVRDFITCIEGLRIVKSELETQVETLTEKANTSEEKLKAFRSQFADKYRVKQERLASIDRELKEWQARAEEQTTKYDNMARLYNEKRVQLDDTNKKWVQVQDEIRNLRLKNETLTRNSSMLNVRKFEENKKIQSLSSQVQRLQTQLEHAERQIRVLRNDTRFSSRPSSISSNILSAVEEVVTPGRMTLSMDDLQHQNNLFRSQSDRFLDSPSAINQRSLDDSLENALKTPVNIKNRRQSFGSDATIPSRSSNELFGQSCISIESSLLSDGQGQSRPYASHPQLSESQVRQECLDENMNSSTSGVQSINAKTSRNLIVSSLPNALGQLDSVCENTANIEMRDPTTSNHVLIPQTLHTEEEPGYDYEFGSLSRVAELQGRNAGTLPHLKSSYPVETQGQTPSKCDESVRIGSARQTLRRLSVMPEQTQKDFASSMQEISMPESRRTTMGGYRDLHASSLRQLQDFGALKRKSHLLNRHPRKGEQGIDRTRSCDVDLLLKTEGVVWRNELPEDELQEQVDPRRESVMFEIPNSPLRTVMRNRTRKAQANSNASKKLLKTPDKVNRKKFLEEKKRTPSLMDRMKKPFSKK